MTARYLSRLVAPTFAVMLVACAASGPPFEAATPSESQASVYIFRPSKLANSAGSRDVVVDGTKVGILKNGGYLPVSLAAGTHKLTIPHSMWDWDLKCASLSLEVKPGMIYYVALDTDASIWLAAVSPTPIGVTSRQCQLALLPEAAALSLIRETRLSR